MAVVQISRIQHRRGRANQGTGIPQLASGELGWAIDTRELYIGNGSISEGAPEVGNTKILTEHDNIFENPSLPGYVYKRDIVQTGPTPNDPIERSLFTRLDDFVNANSFGVVPDGITDNYEQLQRAIDQLYRSSDRNRRVVLYIPAGVYNVSETLEIPSYARIVGDGIGNTVIESGAGIVFKIVSEVPLPEVNNTTQPRNIYFSNMSVVMDLPGVAFELQNCIDSLFENMNITSVWEIGDVESQNRAFTFISNSTAVTCQKNIFRNIFLNNFNYGFYSDYDIRHNTIENCYFNNMVRGVVFGDMINEGPLILGNNGTLTGPLFNIIQNCVFDRISLHAIYVKFGEYNVSKNNKYFLVGTNQGSQGETITPVIFFGSNKNYSDNDYFERTSLLVSNTVPDPYVKEIDGEIDYTNDFRNSVTIGPKLSPDDVIKLPYPGNGTLFIDYVYKVRYEQGIEDKEILRHGVIEITCNEFDEVLILNDEYNFVGDAAYELSLEFSVVKNLIPSYLVLRATNTIPSIQEDQFYFKIRTKM